MRTKHWIVAVLVVAVVSSAQAYALITDKEPDVAPQAAEVETPRSASGPQQVVAQESPTEFVLPDEPVAVNTASDAAVVPDAPEALDPLDEVETLIVGFQKDLGADLMEAIVRAAGATPMDTVSAPGTLVVSVDKADRDATIAQLEINLLVDYVAVPAAPHITSSL